MHTPGPWHTHEDQSTRQSDDWLPVWDNTGLAIATVWAKDNVGLITSTANARLIAAAPAMLEALRTMQQWLKDGSGDLDASIDDIVAAVIKQATGE